MKLGSEFEPFTVQVTADVSISGSQAGNGPALVLVHGFPQTHLIWHKIASKLTSHYRVIALDLRGYGKSSKPTGDDAHQVYSKSTMAQDIVTVMEHLNHSKYYICAHDRGARVAHQLCINHPEKVMKVMLLDIVPTLALFSRTDQEIASLYWHWYFLIQPAPFPETLMLSNPETFAQKFMSSHGTAGLNIFVPEAMAEYTALFKDEACVHGMCEDYRAGATIDLQEQRDNIEQERMIQCPLLVLWGKKGLCEKKFDTLEEWRKVASGGVEGEAVDCGHYIPEEKPDDVLKHIQTFFV